MAMIATIHPYKNENGMSYNQRRTSSSTTSTEREQQPYTSGIFRIEDVTDDPRVSITGLFFKSKYLVVPSGVFSFLLFSFRGTVGAFFLFLSVHPHFLIYGEGRNLR
ncbi:unnamed protein product [Meloidogyne enterolobii]|uniref:Uncharacterized protein n=1 Tax=Meloidogyne enterolobii TaxID=390850 RepID=A0ACB0XM68_MELEN